MSPQTMLLTICLTLFLFLPSAATVWTVSNNPNIPAQFTNINTAIGSSSYDDTIYIHGSPDIYSHEVNLNKRLVLIGPGHNPKNASARAANVHSIVASKKGSNSVISGLNINYLSTSSNPSNDTVNLTIQNCLFGWGASASSINFSTSFTELVIENCIINSGSINFAYISAQLVKKGLVIRNNIFGTYPATGGSSITGVRDNSIIDHNIFLGLNSSMNAFWDIQNCNVSNNIFYGRKIDSTAAQNCVFLNNLTYICTYNKLPLPGNSGSGNMVAVDPGFVNFPNSPTNFSYQFDFRLESDSPARNASTDGTDLGVYGGPGGFSMTGEPRDSPVVRSMEIYNTTVPPGGTLDIRIRSSVAVTD